MLWGFYGAESGRVAGMGQLSLESPTQTSGAPSQLKRRRLLIGSCVDSSRYEHCRRRREVLRAGLTGPGIPKQLKASQSCGFVIMSSAYTRVFDRAFSREKSSLSINSGRTDAAY